MEGFINLGDLDLGERVEVGCNVLVANVLFDGQTKLHVRGMMD